MSREESRPSCVAVSSRRPIVSEVPGRGAVRTVRGNRFPGFLLLFVVSILAGLFQTAPVHADVTLYRSQSIDVETGFWRFEVKRDEVGSRCIVGNPRTCYLMYIDIQNASDQTLDCSAELIYDINGIVEQRDTGRATIAARGAYPIVVTTQGAAFINARAQCTARAPSGQSGGTVGAAPGASGSTAEFTMSINSLSLSQSSATVSVREVVNRRNGGRSGTLYLQLFATESQGADVGYEIGSYRLGELDGGFHFTAFTAEIPLRNLPTPGTYHISVLLAEYPDLDTYMARSNFSAYAFTGPVDNGRGVELEGNVSIIPDWSAGTVEFNVDGVVNRSSTVTTGTLRLELWATSEPYEGGTINGYRVATYRFVSDSNGRLAPGARYVDISRTVPISVRPPVGSYYGTLIVSQFDSENCGTEDNFCIATDMSFSQPLNVTAPPAFVDTGSGFDDGFDEPGAGSSTGGGGGDDGGGGSLDALLIPTMLVMAMVRRRRTHGGGRHSLG